MVKEEEGKGRGSGGGAKFKYVVVREVEEKKRARRGTRGSSDKKHGPLHLILVEEEEGQEE